MERTKRWVVLLQPETAKALKIYAAANGLSMGEMARIALEEQYGDALREQTFSAPIVSTKVNKSAR
jgi:hypothetical protein